jgi:stage II sporulation protein M
LAKGLVEISIIHIKEHLLAWILLFLIFSCGLFIGFSSPNHLNATDANQITVLIDNLIKNIPGMQIDNISEFKNSLFFNGGLVLAIWFLGASIIGAPLVLPILFYKGFTLGFSIGLLFANNAVNGFIIVLLTIVPQNIILLPTFLLATYWAISFAASMFRKKDSSGKSFFHHFCRYTTYFLLIFAAVIAAAFLQGYVAPALLKMFFEII